jgi:hypothetical protein
MGNPASRFFGGLYVLHSKRLCTFLVYSMACLYMDNGTIADTYLDVHHDRYELGNQQRPSARAYSSVLPQPRIGKTLGTTRWGVKIKAQYYQACSSTELLCLVILSLYIIIFSLYPNPN